MSASVTRIEVVWQFRNRLKRMIKNRLNYVRNWISEHSGARAGGQPPAGGCTVCHLQPGDIVRVRSRDEIQATLDRWNELRGCGFMEEMRPYCGTPQRVLKRVEKFLDERDYRIKQCKGIVILDGVVCQGTVDFGGCDRSCFFFWREEWLESMNRR
jgi:hypothetical protein